LVHRRSSQERQSSGTHRPGNTVSSIARLLGVSRATIYTYLPEMASGHSPAALPASRMPIERGANQR
jgi:hypothetical protein